MRKLAQYYKAINDKNVACELCPHKCIISEGKRGLCGVRESKSGLLYAMNYGRITSVSLDPIEKKPLYHFKPGSNILSVGSFGCNFKCGFCQNYSISQYEAKSQILTSKQLIDTALNTDDNIGLAFTYNEPLIGYEFLYDVCKEAMNTNLSMVLVSNGYINHKPLDNILPFIDAANIDLKAFTQKYYKEVCFGDIDTVLSNICFISSKCHLEVTTLLVNGYNDSDEEICNLSKWIAEINPDIPLHLSRYYPTYKFKDEPTPIERMLNCRDIAKKYLNYVYIGNVSGIDNNTYCPNCHGLIIKRDGFHGKSLVDDDKCPKCGSKINIVL